MSTNQLFEETQKKTFYIKSDIFSTIAFIYPNGNLKCILKVRLPLEVTFISNYRLCGSPKYLPLTLNVKLFL